MPIYEYKCEKCGSKFTLLQPVSASRVGTPCPRCGSNKTARVMSTFSQGRDCASCDVSQFT